MNYRPVWSAMVAMVAVAVLTAPALAQGGKQQVSESDKAEAGEHFRRGADLFQEGIYRGALVELERAYEIAPNYRVLYNIGQTHVALGEYVEAIRAFEAYLHQGGSEVEDERRSEVENEIAQLGRRTGRLTIRVNRAGAVVSVDGTKVGQSPLPGSVPVNVGEHRITAEMEDGATAGQTLRVAGGDALAVDLELDFPKPTPVVVLPPVQQAAPDTGLSVRQKWGVGLLSAGAGLALVGGGLALAAKSAKEDHDQALEQEPGNAQTLRDTSDQISRRALAADLMFVGAIGLATAGLVVVFTKGRGDREDAQSAELRLRLTPTAVVAEGRF